MSSASPHRNENPSSSSTANNSSIPGRKLSLRGSPRSSIDSNIEKTSGSPFLHNLQQRFRKSSNASSHSQDNPSNSPPPAAAPPQPAPPKDSAVSEQKSRVEATRAAKRYLLSVIRDDWEYPPPKGSERNQQNPAIPHREPITYVKREDGSDYEDNKQWHQHQQQQRRAAAAEDGKRRQSSGTTGTGAAEAEKEEWKYESPDSFTRFATERAHKKRRLMEEECKWNEGLRVWVGRRDEWTEAVSQKPKMKRRSGVEGGAVSGEDRGDGSGESGGRRRSSKERERKRSSGLRNVLMERNGSESTTTDSTATGTTTDETGSNENGAQDKEANSLDAVSPERDTSSPHEEEEKVNSTDMLDFPSLADTDDGPYLPIYPPLFDEDNVLREKINPAAYSTIYSKVVIQVLAPNIPIPLTHMTRALVAGWKEENQWPPPASQPLAQDVKSGKKSSKFGRWRRQKLGVGNTNAGGDGGVKDKAIGVVKNLWSGKSDGGLKEIGIEFEEQDTEDLEGNMELNKSLLVEKGRL